jgi:hypothetical protein
MSIRQPIRPHCTSALFGGVQNPCPSNQVRISQAVSACQGQILHFLFERAISGPDLGTLNLAHHKVTSLDLYCRQVHEKLCARDDVSCLRRFARRHCPSILRSFEFGFALACARGPFCAIPVISIARSTSGNLNKLGSNGGSNGVGRGRHRHRCLGNSHRQLLERLVETRHL